MSESGLISPSLISVIIQGPLYRALAPERGILRCIESIREYLPGAEIVVSTWRGEDLSDLDQCVVISSIAPPVLCGVTENQVNTNRQILSTRLGIEAASRPYVLKFRADHFLTGSALTYMSEYQDGLPELRRMLRRPITVTNLFIRNPVRVPMLFHLSDVVQFGLREDVMDIWSRPMLTESEQFLAQGARKSPLGNFIGYSDWRMVPEQAITIGWLNSKGYNLTLNHVCHVTTEMLELWEAVLFDNFYVLSWMEAGISYPDRFLRDGYSVKTVYSPKDIQRAKKLNRCGRLVRRMHVWLNQYVLCICRPVWIVSALSIILFSLSPKMAVALRSIWRRFRGVVHGSSGRV